MLFSAVGPCRTEARREHATTTVKGSLGMQMGCRPSETHLGTIYCRQRIVETCQRQAKTHGGTTGDVATATDEPESKHHNLSDEGHGTCKEFPRMI